MIFHNAQGRNAVSYTHLDVYKRQDGEFCGCRPSRMGKFERKRIGSGKGEIPEENSGLPAGEDDTSRHQELSLQDGRQIQTVFSAGFILFCILKRGPNSYLPPSVSLL